MKAGSSSSEGRDENNTKETSRRTFSCIFCKGEFSISQALGGHQNPHKAEHELKKQLNHMIDDDDALGSHDFPYYTSPSVLSTAPYYNQLGVRMDSMIQKPTYPRTPDNFGYHGAMFWQQMLNTSDVRLRDMEGTAGGSGINNNVRSILNFGDSSTNLATSSSTIMMVGQEKSGS